MTNGSFQSCSPALHCDFYCRMGEMGQFLHPQKQKVMKCWADVDFLSAGRKGWRCPQLRKETGPKLPFLKTVRKVWKEHKGKVTVSLLKSIQDVVCSIFQALYVS